MEKMKKDEWNDDDEDYDRNMMIGSSSSEGKIVIKIKIPKVQETAAEAAMEGEKSLIKDVIEKRVCLECNKEFSSGKALGGHMRVHANAHVHVKRNPNFLKPLKKFKKKTGYQDSSNNGVQKPYYMNSVNEEGEPTCSLCGKTFPSMKSLFGHMRCHPERDWRGILPPPNTPNTVNTTVRRRTVASGDHDDDHGGDEVVDLMKFVRGWSVRDRRGRKAVKKVMVDDDDDDEGLLGAVEDLLSLANGCGSMAESTNIIEENGNSPSIGKGKAVIVEEEDEADDDESDVKNNINEEVLVNNKCMKIKKRKKMKLMMELEQQQEEQLEGVNVNVTEGKYKCTTCNKCFATHQALGGHRSSHNKAKITSMDQHQQIQEDDQESFVMMMVKSGENLDKGLHQCKICNKVFATGQALGGHKRCHWTGTIEAEAQAQAQAQAPSSQITSTGEAGSSGQKVLDFDLNEIPQVMMEEEEFANANGYEYGYGYGYASSSYNSSYN